MENIDENTRELDKILSRKNNAKRITGLVDLMENNLFFRYKNQRKRIEKELIKSLAALKKKEADIHYFEYWQWCLSRIFGKKSDIVLSFENAKENYTNLRAIEHLRTMCY